MATVLAASAAKRRSLLHFFHFICSICPPMNRHATACLLLFLVAGCASTPPAESTANVKQQNCEREYRVGSMLPVKNCEPPMTDLERERMMEALRSKIRPGASPPPVPAGGG